MTGSGSSSDRRTSACPRQARSTALFTLAAELPAAILARMLGIHISVAVQWQGASSGDWMTYAAARPGSSPFRHVTKRRTKRDRPHTVRGP